MKLEEVQRLENEFRNAALKYGDDLHEKYATYSDKFLIGKEVYSENKVLYKTISDLLEYAISDIHNICKRTTYGDDKYYEESVEDLEIELDGIFKVLDKLM